MEKHEMKPPADELFQVRDLLIDKSVVSRVSRVFGIETGGRIVRLSLLILLTFGILAVFTSLEGRFMLRSVTRPLEGFGDILGMSFLGDTMVWPFIFLVPLGLILVKLAVNRSVLMLNKLIGIMHARTEGDNPEIDQLVTDTKAIFRFQFNRWGKVLLIAPWLVFLSFWIYNTSTCAFHDVIGEAFYPYKNRTVLILKNPAIPPTRLPAATRFPATRVFKEKIQLPKWDTDRKAAPLSTWAARIWTIFFYGLPPFLLARLIALIWGVTFFLKRFLILIRRLGTRQKPIIKPFSEDSYGGLGFIANTGMAFFYATSSFLFLVLMSLFKEGADPSWHNYFLILALMPISVLTFVIPTRYVKETIQNAKDSYLSAISDKINALFFYTMDNERPEDAEGILENVSTLHMFYHEVKKMPVWPFSSSAFMKISFTAFTPVFMIIIDKILSKYIS